MTAYDSTSFSAGQDCGTRIAACVARVAAFDLIDDARWWNRRRRREMARALFACAEELECGADADRRRGPAELEDEPISRAPAPSHDRGAEPLTSRISPSCATLATRRPPRS
jgi:hypothetical protein